MASIYKCPPSVEVTWRESPPYLYTDGNFSVVGIFPRVMRKIAWECCGEKTQVEFLNTFGRDEAIEQMIRNETTDIIFPIFGEARQSQYLGGPFLPIIQSQGVALYGRQYLTSKQVLLDALYGAWPILVFVCLLSMVTGALVWLAELSSRPFDSKASLTQRIVFRFQEMFSDCYWAVVSGATVGYGDLLPSTIHGRLLAIAWIITGTIAISLFTASITSVLVSVVTTNDLTVNGAVIGTLLLSAEYRLAIRLNARVQAYNDIKTMVDHLTSRKLDGILIDSYAAGHHHEILSVARLENVLDYSSNYGMALTRSGVNMVPCLKKQISKHQDTIMKMTTAGFRPLTLPQHSLSNEKSSKLLSIDSPVMQHFLLAIITAVCALFLIGIAWEFLWRRRKENEKERKLLRTLSGVHLKHKLENDEMWGKLESDILQLEDSIERRLQKFEYCDKDIDDIRRMLGRPGSFRGMDMICSQMDHQL